MAQPRTRTKTVLTPPPGGGGAPPAAGELPGSSSPHTPKKDSGRKGGCLTSSFMMVATAGVSALLVTSNEVAQTLGIADKILLGSMVGLATSLSCYAGARIGRVIGKYVGGFAGLIMGAASGCVFSGNENRVNNMFTCAFLGAAAGSTGGAVLLYLAGFIGGGYVGYHLSTEFAHQNLIHSSPQDVTPETAGQGGDKDIPRISSLLPDYRPGT